MNNSIKIGSKVFHKEVGNGKNLLEVVGIRRTQIELDGDFSDNEKHRYQISWMPIDGILYSESNNAITDEDIEFMQACNMYPSNSHEFFGNKTINVIKIMTENSEGAILDPDDLLKLSDILFRYVKSAAQ